MTDTIRQAIARYAVEESLTIGDEVRNEARRRVLDSIGTAMGALEQPGPLAAFRYARRLAVTDGCVIWGTDIRTPAEVATFVNGASIRCLDFSDTYFGRDSSHMSDAIGGFVALAEERGRTGRELLDAMTVAYEVSIACADAFGVGAHGWDNINVSAIGTCAGAARLIGLDQYQTEQALALTIVPHAAMSETRAGELSMWKGLAGPHASRHAVNACQLAEVGVEGPFRPFEGKKAFINLMLGGAIPVPEALDPVHELRAPSRILDTHMKAWPLGTVSQAAAAATLEARAKLHEDAEIARVRIGTYAVAMDRMASPEKYRPVNRATADHSLPFGVASALRDGDITEATYAEERINDPEMHAFMAEVIEVFEDPEMTAAYPKAMPASVEIVTTTGESSFARVDHPPGSAGNPFTEAELEDKFRGLVEPVLGAERTEAIIEATAALPTSEDVRGVTELLHVTP